MGGNVEGIIFYNQDVFSKIQYQFGIFDAHVMIISKFLPSFLLLSSVIFRRLLLLLLLMALSWLNFFRWGQVFILDALSRYKAADAREAENIVERVTPRLQHANCAVVLSAVKVTSQLWLTGMDLTLSTQWPSASIHFLTPFSSCPFIFLFSFFIYLLFTNSVFLIDDPSTNGTHH